MKQQLLAIHRDRLEKTSGFEGLDKLDPKQQYWLELYEDDRMAIIDFLKDFGFESRLLHQVEEPGRTNKVQLIKDSLLANLVIIDTEDVYHSAYLSIIARDNLLITVLPEDSLLFEDLKSESDSNLLEYDLSLYHVIYYIAAEVVQHDLDCLTEMRKKVKQLSLRLDEEADAVPLNEIILCKREVSQLTNIVEDQYNMLGLMPKMNWKKGASTIRSELMELISGLGHVQNSFERLEEKVDAIHTQYQLILQEKGNKRLNVLTVVQSVFVPLTLITGVYGMNFIVMPELEWKYGYFLIWGVMIAITTFQMLWFKRKGWFD